MQKHSTTKMKQHRRKMGKTLLVSSQKGQEETIDASYFTSSNLTGLQKVTDKEGRYFLLFGDYSQAKDALIHLRKEFHYFVKFVHYKIFFTCSQLTEVTPSADFEHETFKTAMRELVQGKTNGHVLYPPKLYLSNDKTSYTGCGNITVDTKECEDALLTKNGDLKFSKIGSKGQFEVAFYRFRQNKSTKESPEQMEST